MEKTTLELMRLQKIVTELEKKLQCNCDLDKWEPEEKTGHSFVCRIHKHATERMKRCNQDAS